MFSFSHPCFLPLVPLFHQVHQPGGGGLLLSSDLIAVPSTVPGLGTVFNGSAGLKSAVGGTGDAGTRLAFIGPTIGIKFALSSSSGYSELGGAKH